MTDSGFVSRLQQALGSGIDVERSAALSLLRGFQKGNPQALIDWYNNGADGQIDWGVPGDFMQCVDIASQHIDDAEGFCQERHIDATGEPAGKGAHGGAGEGK